MINELSGYINDNEAVTLTLAPQTANLGLNK